VVPMANNSVHAMATLVSGDRVQIDTYNLCFGEYLFVQSSIKAEHKRGVVLRGVEEPGFLAG
jgi:hypothetical protein